MREAAIAFVAVGFVAVLGALVAFNLPPGSINPPAIPSVSIPIPSLPITLSPTATPVPKTPPADLKSFKSFTEASGFLKSATPSGYGYFGRGMMVDAVMPMAAAGAMESAKSGEVATDYSSTNVQVEGVDEADTVKNDGKYVYTITQGKIVIVEAFPPASAKVVATIEGSFQNIFVNGDKLAAFGRDEFDWEPIVKPIEDDYLPPQPPEGTEITGSAAKRAGVAIVPPYRPYYRGSSFIKVYDISDRFNPRLLKTIDSRGNYVQSRMIGSKVYAVFSEYAYYGVPRPLYAVDGKLREIAPSEVSYFDYPFDSYQFTTVLGLDLNDLQKEESRKIVLMGGAQTIYVSKDNAYITYTRYDDYYAPVPWEAYEEELPPLPPEYEGKIAAVDVSDASEWRKENLKVGIANDYLQSLGGEEATGILQRVYEKQQEIIKKRPYRGERTVVHKFALGDGISYEGYGEAPGHLLNQFSLDESGGYLRMATTKGEVSRMQREIPAVNNVYVLDSNLNIAGRLEDLAPGEKIYSARFMGDRAYLVTFKKVDPLFVIGLEDPRNPTLLGKLKIPGYSDYLHPYDETHLIGLGKDAVPAEEGDFAWYQGVKLSLFDVSDVSNPKELSSFKIGDRGTESYALRDHKAFLFSKARNLLVIPILLAEIDESKSQGTQANTYGEFKFQGAYVFRVSPEEGFVLRGTISHADPSSFLKAGEYYRGSDTDVTRSLYMDDFLYTVSGRTVKANDLNSLAELAKVDLPYKEYDYGYPYIE